MTLLTPGAAVEVSMNKISIGKCSRSGLETALLKARSRRIIGVEFTLAHLSIGGSALHISFIDQR